MEENDAIMFSKDSDISFDSLPYVDSYEGMEDKIKELIELEMKNFTPVNYLEKYPPISLKFDIQQKIEPIDITRYKVNPPPPNKKNDIQSWKQSLQNAYSQLEHQNLRFIFFLNNNKFFLKSIENLELLITYGINAWREYNKYLESIQKKLQELLENLKKEIENINLQRKNEQVNNFYFYFLFILI